jgi:hypothetical protein
MVQSDEEPPNQHEGADSARDPASARKVARLTAGIGAIAAILELMSFFLLSRLPGGSATDEEIIAFYHSESERIPTIAGLYVMPFAGIAFIWFVVLLRMWIRAEADRRNVMQSNIQLTSGILYIAIFFVSAAAMSVFAATAQLTDQEIDPTLARQFPNFAHTLLLVFGMRMAAMFVFTTSALGMKSKLMPKRFAYLGYAFGVFLLLSVSLFPWLALVFPAWILMVCVHIYLRSRTIPPDAVMTNVRMSRSHL